MVDVGLRHGSALSPVLFIAVVEVISRKASTRDILRKLLYADDLAVVADSETDLQERLVDWKDIFGKHGGTGTAARGRRHGDGGTGTAARGRRHGGGGTGTAARGRRHGGGGTGTAARGRRHVDSGTGTAARGRRHGDGGTETAARGRRHGDGGTWTEIRRRKQAGASAWRKVERVMGERHISLKLKGMVLSSCITPATG